MSDPNTEPDLFDAAGLAPVVDGHRGDVEQLTACTTRQVASGRSGR